MDSEYLEINSLIREYKAVEEEEEEENAIFASFKALTKAATAGLDIMKYVG